ncbi:MAG: hypothetical protein M3291_08630 [Actinomycetota bacterium]|nr:hypothetical protein [Actinomycetota bacterium]
MVAQDLEQVAVTDPPAVRERRVDHSGPDAALWALPWDVARLRDQINALGQGEPAD